MNYTNENWCSMSSVALRLPQLPQFIFEEGSDPQYWITFDALTDIFQACGKAFINRPVALSFYLKVLLLHFLSLQPIM